MQAFYQAEGCARYCAHSSLTLDNCITTHGTKNIKPSLTCLLTSPFMFIFIFTFPYFFPLFFFFLFVLLRRDTELDIRLCFQNISSIYPCLYVEGKKFSSLTTFSLCVLPIYMPFHAHTEKEEEGRKRWASMCRRKIVRWESKIWFIRPTGFAFGKYVLFPFVRTAARRMWC